MGQGVELDPKKLLPPEDPRPFLSRRWVSYSLSEIVGRGVLPAFVLSY